MTPNQKRPEGGISADPERPPPRVQLNGAGGMTVDRIFAEHTPLNGLDQAIGEGLGLQTKIHIRPHSVLGYRPQALEAIMPAALNLMTFHPGRNLQRLPQKVVKI